MPQIRLLGGVGAAFDDGRSIDVGPAKCQALLAALALSAGSPVPVDRLVDLVWGESPPRTAAKTLQTYVGRLRHELGADTIARVGSAYRLDVDPQAVDALRFESRIADGDTAGALAEWTGTPLAGLDAVGLGAAVDRLVELWLSAVEAELSATVEREPPAAIAPLTELTATYPFREGLWALLMTALARAGRQADALAAYRRARTHLVEELGLEPGPALREMESMVLDQDGRVAASSRPSAPTGTLTFAFSDIEDSTAMWAAHRERMATAVARHDTIIRTLAGDHGGYVFATAGDSFGVAFTRASAAADWSFDVHRALSVEPWRAGLEVRVRIGLHTGEADERQGDYFGKPVSTAARIAAAGHGGQTLVSDVTSALLDRDDLVELGRFRLAGLDVDLALRQMGPGTYPALRTDEVDQGNLPPRLGVLLGRDAALAQIDDAIEASSLVTLVGPGGIGKTRLAIAAARTAADGFDGGVWLVELADIADPSGVTRAVADALDVRLRPGRSITESLLAHLDRAPTMIVLDNCEHVVDAAADLAAAVGDRSPTTSVLATSREGLGVSDERIIAVGPLDTDGSAIDLFAERALAVDAGFDLDEHRAAVEEICRRLDGVPLAIEIAAGRLGALSPEDLVQLLDDRLRTLTGGRRRTVERHRTLRAAIQWSVDLLAPEERAVFRRLSVFAGSFDLHAATTVAASGELRAADVPTIVGDLVDRSMLAIEHGRFGRRYRLLETIRQFGAELLADADETEATAALHAAAILDDVAAIGPMLRSRREAEGVDRLEELWPNLRAAVDWAIDHGDHATAMSLLRPVAIEPFVRRGAGEITTWVERTLEIIPRDDVVGTTDCLVWLAMHLSISQDRDAARSLIERYGDSDHVLVRYSWLMAVEDDHFGALDVGPLAAAEMRRRGETSVARLFELFTGGALLTAGRFDESDAVLGELAGIARDEGPPTALNWALYMLGASASVRGDHETAERYWAEVVQIPLPQRTNAPTQTLEARAAFAQGRRREAFLLVRNHLDELTESDNLSGVAVVGMEFVNMMVAIGELDAAAVVVGHFDETGLLSTEEPGFKSLIADAVAAVADDPAATAVRLDAAAARLDERGAVVAMRKTLDRLLAGPSDQ